MIVKVRWLKYLAALLFIGYQLVLVFELKAARQKYEQGIAHIRYVQGEQFLLQENFRLTTESYTQSWALQNKTAEMMFTMGQDICDKRRGLLKRFPNVAHQINNGSRPTLSPSSPWE